MWPCRVCYDPHVKYLWLKTAQLGAAMSRPRGYGPDRLRAVEAKSVDKAKGELKKDFKELLEDVSDLSCRYLGVDRDGEAASDAKARRTSLLHV